MTQTTKKIKRLRMKPSIQDLSVEVLRKARKPLHYREIMKDVLKLHPLGGKTPDMTFYSLLFRSKKFKNLGRGVFDLSDRNEPAQKPNK